MLSLGGGALLGRAVAFLGTAYLTRVLGPEGFGIVGFALAITTYVSVLVDGGVHTVGTREVAAAPERAALLAASVTAVRLLVAVGAFGVLAVVALVLDKPDAVRLVVLLSGLVYLALALDTSWVFKGLSRNALPGASIVLTEGVAVVLLLLLVRGPEDVAYVPVALFGGQLASSVVLLGTFFRGRSLQVDLRLGLEMLLVSGYVIGTRLLRTLFFSFDVVMLGFWIGEQPVGLYTAGNRVALLLTALTTAILYAYLPEFTRAVRESPGHVARVFERATEVTSVLTAPFVVGGIVLAGPLMALLFGAPFAEGAWALRFLLLGVGCAAFRALTWNVLLVHERLRLDFFIMLGATGLNVVLNLVLIPRFSLTGAAVATAISEGVNLLLGTVAMWRLGVRPSARPALKSAVAAAAMGAVLIALRPSLPTVALLAVGVGAYGAALMLIGGVPESVRASLHRLRARPG